MWTSWKNQVAHTIRREIENVRKESPTVREADYLVFLYRLLYVLGRTDADSFARELEYVIWSDEHDINAQNFASDLLVIMSKAGVTKNACSD